MNHVRIVTSGIFLAHRLCMKIGHGWKTDRNSKSEFQLTQFSGVSSP